MVDPQHEDDLPAWKRALAERLVDGRLTGFVARAVHARIRRDPAWSRRYDLLRRVERAAAGGTAFSAGQRAMVKEMLFAAAAAPAPEPAPARSWVWGGGLATACAAAALFVAVRAPVEDQTLVARGVDLASIHVGLRARCLDAAGAKVVDEAEAGTAGRVKDPVLSCPKDGLVAFSATNLGAAPRHLLVVGVAPDGSLRWYAPFQKQGGSVAVAPGAVDAVLGAVADTRAMAPDDEVALFALFAERPVSSADAADAVRRARERGLNLRALTRLPIDVDAQARIDLVRGRTTP